MKRILLSHEDIQIVSEVRNTEELLSGDRKSQAEVMIVAHPATGGGYEYLTHLRREYPLLRIIVVTRSSTLDQVLVALRQGVRGFLDASCTAEHLPAAIRAVSAGRIYLQEEVSSLIASDMQVLDKDQSHRSLTQRELQIFMKLASGKKVSEIAIELDISIKTVSTHKSHIMEKMGMSSLSQLIQYAIASNLFDHFTNENRRPS